MKKIMATVFTPGFFLNGVTQIASVHSNSYDSVDEIIVYDLGLSEEESETLNRFAKVKVLQFPHEVNTYYDGYLDPWQNAYKPFVIKDAGNYGDLVLYLDADAAVLKDLKPVYEQIAKDEIFLVQDRNNSNFLWTHQRALELLRATDAEKYGQQLWAGILGYQKNGKFQKMIDEAFAFSLNKAIVHGSHQNHRHAQSIYSILAIRHQCPVQPIEIYGEWRGILDPNQVIYVHRGAYKNLAGLRLR